MVLHSREKGDSGAKKKKKKQRKKKDKSGAKDSAQDPLAKVPLSIFHVFQCVLV